MQHGPIRELLIGTLRCRANTIIACLPGVMVYLGMSMGLL